MKKDEQPEKTGKVPLSEMTEAQAASVGGRNNYMLPASILIAGVLIAGSVVYLVKSGNSGGASGAAALAQPQNIGQQAKVGSADALKLTSADVVLGKANAPVTFIEYGDYQCPFCGRFFTDTEPQLTKNYIDAGKVKFVFRNFQFLGPESTASAEAAECAKEQGKFWQYHAAVYSAEIKDGRENNGNLNRDLFMRLVADVGLNAQDFGKCVDSGKYADKIKNDYANAQSAGVNSTPTSFVNGQIVQGALPYAQFASVIDSALKTR